MFDAAGLHADTLPAIVDGGAILSVLPTHPFDSERGIEIRAMVVHDDGPGLRELLEQTTAGILPVRIDTVHDLTGSEASAEDAIQRACAAAVTPGRRGRQVLRWV